VFTRLRPTDVARFEAASRRWLRKTLALEPPERYARRIDRALDMYAESLEASRDAAAAAARGDVAALETLNAEANRLSVQSTKLLYDVGFASGFDRFARRGPPNPFHLGHSFRRTVSLRKVSFFS
jgi:hypothetical protein